MLQFLIKRIDCKNMEVNKEENYYFKNKSIMFKDQ